jgi:hypothetical protein
MQKNHSRYFIGLDLSSTDKLAIANWRDKKRVYADLYYKQKRRG